jgi:transcriptional regulator with XRE-family HTH domain
MNTNYDRYVGNNIRLLRKKLNLTQTQVADAMGTTQGAVGQMERGDAPISHRLICTASDLMGITPSTIDPQFYNKDRFGKRRVDFAKSNFIYVLYNPTIEWSKLGVSNDPLTRSKALSNATSSPGHFDLIKYWDVGPDALNLETETLTNLAVKGHNVDGELVKCASQTVIDAVQSLIDSNNT